MAASGAIAQAADGCIAVLTRFIIISMTTSTIRCVCSVGPSISSTFRCTSMATATANSSAVIDVIRAAMSEAGRCPSAGSVAVITRGRSYEVIAWLTGCSRAIVAGRTGSRRDTVVIKAGCHPRSGRMATFTIVIRCYVI
jgi:hypothetical protein